MAGYFGGKLDSLLMRITEAILIIPQIFLLLVMAKFFGGQDPRYQRARAHLQRQCDRDHSDYRADQLAVPGAHRAREFLSLKENEFILAARATGTSTSEIIFRHILPNSIAPIVVSATLGVANAITAEAYISFLGLGVRRPPPPGAICSKAPTTTLKAPGGCGSSPAC